MTPLDISCLSPSDLFRLAAEFPELAPQIHLPASTAVQVTETHVLTPRGLIVRNADVRLFLDALTNAGRVRPTLPRCAAFEDYRRMFNRGRAKIRAVDPVMGDAVALSRVSEVPPMFPGFRADELFRADARHGRRWHIVDLYHG